MLGARDDFLSGVAALAEADAVQEIEIEHLCDEGFARRQIYLRQTGMNIRASPVVLDALSMLDIAGQPALGESRCRADHPVAAGVAVDARDADVVLLRVAGARLRSRKSGGLRAMYARDTQEFAGIFDPDLGSK